MLHAARPSGRPTKGRKPPLSSSTVWRAGSLFTKIACLIHLDTASLPATVRTLNSGPKQREQKESA
jgi:hypothetical protein